MFSLSLFFFFSGSPSLFITLSYSISLVCSLFAFNIISRLSFRPSSVFLTQLLVAIYLLYLLLFSSISPFFSLLSLFSLLLLSIYLLYLLLFSSISSSFSLLSLFSRLLLVSPNSLAFQPCVTSSTSIRFSLPILFLVFTSFFSPFFYFSTYLC